MVIGIEHIERGQHIFRSLALVYAPRISAKKISFTILYTQTYSHSVHTNSEGTISYNFRSRFLQIYAKQNFNIFISAVFQYKYTEVFKESYTFVQYIAIFSIVNPNPKVYVHIFSTLYYLYYIMYIFVIYQCSLRSNFPYAQIQHIYTSNSRVV